MNRRYFGTDGIRGRVGETPITADFVLKLGWAAGRVLAHQGKGGGKGHVIIGKDTRISGYMFESALEAGFSAAGVDVSLLGPMPTPAIAYLARTFRAKAGVVISASHNPYYDNGIKFFSGDGTKLPDETELAIEAELDKCMQTVDGASLGKAARVEDARGRYIEFCKRTLPYATSFDELKIVVDCANGATYQIAPRVFSELGAEVIAIGVKPDGLNINQGCGSTQPEALRMAVLEHGADLGIALDGDGDRVLMVDEQGELLDGDELLYIIARARREDVSFPNTVVGTVMSNLGLEHALRRESMELKRARVGDRYVLELLREGGWVLGGESSGHIICLDRTTTGDGIVAALQVLGAMRDTGTTLGELKRGMEKYPQTLINVPTNGVSDLHVHPRVAEAQADAEAELGADGRVLLRPSGTEPLLRVMVEGMDAGQVNRVAHELAQVVESVAASAAA